MRRGGFGIGTIEVETAFLRHPAVAEVGVTGRPDELRGEIISAFVVLKQLNRDPGDISTIEDAGSVEEARDAWRDLQLEVASP